MTAFMTAELRERFQQFARNGRWGTCASCPRDRSGHVYPEFCAETERYDHRLTLPQLAEQYERAARADGDGK